MPMFAFRSDAADVIKVVRPQPRSPGPSRLARARPPRRGRMRQHPRPADAADLVASSLSRHAEQTGLLVASAIAPTTFARSLGPRSAMDQGIVTGIVTGLTYAVTVAT